MPLHLVKPHESREMALPLLCMNPLAVRRNESSARRHKPKYTAVDGMLKTNPAQRAAFMGRICFSKWDLFKGKLNGYKELALTITQKMNPVFAAGSAPRYDPDGENSSSGAWQQAASPAEPRGDVPGCSWDSLVPEAKAGISLRGVCSAHVRKGGWEQPRFDNPYHLRSQLSETKRASPSRRLLVLSFPISPSPSAGQGPLQCKHRLYSLAAPASCINCLRKPCFNFTGIWALTYGYRGSMHQ